MLLSRLLNVPWKKISKKKLNIFKHNVNIYTFQNVELTFYNDFYSRFHLLREIIINDSYEYDDMCLFLKY